MSECVSPYFIGCDRVLEIYEYLGGVCVCVCVFVRVCARAHICGFVSRGGSYDGADARVYTGGGSGGDGDYMCVCARIYFFVRLCVYVFVYLCDGRAGRDRVGCSDGTCKASPRIHTQREREREAYTHTRHTRIHIN